MSGPTLMQICEYGWQQPDGTIDWTETIRRPDTSANRTRILNRDSTHPTSVDGWKIVPAGPGGYMSRIRWDDIRLYAEEHR